MQPFTADPLLLHGAEDVKRMKVKPPAARVLWFTTISVACSLALRLNHFGCNRIFRPFSRSLPSGMFGVGQHRHGRLTEGSQSNPRLSTVNV